MTKASINLQELRRKIYRKAKTEKHWRFWGLHCHICKKEVLEEAYRLAKANDGAPGVDGKRFDDIEAEGVEGFLEGIRQELLERSYRKKLKGFGWKKWSREDIYEKWGLYNDYQIRYIRPKATPGR